MKALTTTNAAYSNLLKHIKQEIAEALTRAHLAFEHEKIIAYWRIGESIALHLSQVHGGAGYGTQLYKNLSRDLGLGERLLYQVTQFYYAYPDFLNNRVLPLGRPCMPPHAETCTFSYKNSGAKSAPLGQVSV